MLIRNGICTSEFWSTSFEPNLMKSVLDWAESGLWNSRSIAKGTHQPRGLMLVCSDDSQVRTVVQEWMIHNIRISNMEALGLWDCAVMRTEMVKLKPLTSKTTSMYLECKFTFVIYILLISALVKLFSRVFLVYFFKFCLSFCVGVKLGLSNWS